MHAILCAITAIMSNTAASMWYRRASALSARSLGKSAPRLLGTCPPRGRRRGAFRALRKVRAPGSSSGFSPCSIAADLPSAFRQKGASVQPFGAGCMQKVVVISQRGQSPHTCTSFLSSGMWGSSVRYRRRSVFRSVYGTVPCLGPTAAASRPDGLAGCGDVAEAPDCIRYARQKLQRFRHKWRLHSLRSTVDPDFIRYARQSVQRVRNQ